MSNANHAYALPPDYDTPQFQCFLATGVVFWFCTMLYRIALEKGTMVWQHWDGCEWRTVGPMTTTDPATPPPPDAGARTQPE